MSLTVEDKGNFKSAPQGTHMGRCIKVIDLGTQESEWPVGSGKIKQQKKLFISWELPNELIDEGDLKGQPYSVGSFYTASLGEKANLRRDLESWRGKAFSEQERQGFDITALLGKPCMVTVVHNDKGKANVTAVTAVPKGMEVPNNINPLVFFDMSNWDSKRFDELTDGIKKMIKNSVEYHEQFSEHSESEPGYDDPGQPVDEGDIPF